MKTKTTGSRKRRKLKIVSGLSSESVLPDELIRQILLRLPVTTLAQFKCVSKSWKSLISSSQFAKEHLQTSTPRPQLVYSFGYQPNFKSLSVQSLLQNPLPIPDESHNLIMYQAYRILGSCNGLICLCINHCFIKLYNPSIKLMSKSVRFGSWLSQRITHYGFGYDHVNDKYKLLVAIRDHGMTVTRILTFCSKSWKVAKDFPCEPIRSLGKFVNGTLNWIAEKENDQWVILFFNLATEMWGQMLLPDGNNDNVCKPTVIVLHNCLGVSFLDFKKSHWVVWLMKEYGVQSSWTKLITIPNFTEGDWTWNDLMISHTKFCHCSICPSLDPFSISEDGIAVFKVEDSRVVVYNSSDGKLCHYMISGCHIFSYRDSLVSPKLKYK